ncbi:MAG: hypothetical protein IT372_03580, partial [Polyangiaceae bacterium]|nr:hypothetical protein [Polyangiaceae bacterium]
MGQPGAAHVPHGRGHDVRDPSRVIDARGPEGRGRAASPREGGSPDCAGGERRRREDGGGVREVQGVRARSALSRHRQERPRAVEEDRAPIRRLAQEIADWVLEPERAAGGWVVGVYGGRGTGKTSLLFTLLDILRKREEASNSPGKTSPCVLPARSDQKVDEHRSEEVRELALFAPADAGHDDDLLFLLLEHLKKYPGSGKCSGFQEVWTAQVKKQDSDRFFKLAEEMSPSDKQLPQDFVRIHGEIAETTAKIREGFKVIVSHLKTRDQRLVLLVDDLDLQPHRTLELLELLNLFLNQPGVVVIVAADRDLLVRSIAQALRKRDIDRADIADALLAKYIPYQWTLPIPREAERLNEVWAAEPNPGDELPDWWSERAVALYRAYWPEGTSRHREAPQDPRDLAKQLLAPLLPRTYRGLAAFHNRLRSLRAGPTTALTPAGWPGLGVGDDLVAPLISMVVAVDVRFPELDLMSALRETPSMMTDVRLQLQSDRRREPDPEEEDRARLPRSRSEGELVAETLDRIAETIEQGLRGKEGPSAELPVLDRLTPPYLDGRRLGEARKVMRQFAAAWAELIRHSAPAPVGRERFLTISMMIDALALVESLWRGRYDETSVKEWHIDLRPLVSAGRGAPQELRAARTEALRMLRERGILGYEGRVELHLKAKLVFTLWLGWELRYLKPVTAYNVVGDARVVFAGPTEPIRFEDIGFFRLLHPEPPQVSSEPSREAVVLVDLIGKSL